MISIILLAFPLAFGWMILTNRLALDSFILGYVFSIGILILIGAQRTNLKLTRIPGQLFWLVVYGFYLVIDIFLSGVDVARRVLDPKMPINPGVIPVSGGKDCCDTFTAGLNAHGITITPGELVVDFDPDDESVMYVHALDVDDAKERLVSDQERRLKMIRRIRGRD